MYTITLNGVFFKNMKSKAEARATAKAVVGAQHGRAVVRDKRGHTIGIYTN